MGNANHLPDLPVFQRRAGEHAEAVKVHKAGDHNFHKVPAALADLLDQSAVFLHGIKPPANEAAIVAPLVDGEEGSPVGDAVCTCQRPGPLAHAPPVAPISEVCKPQGPVSFQPEVDQVLPGAVPVGGNGVFVIHPIQDHVDVTICIHGVPPVTAG